MAGHICRAVYMILIRSTALWAWLYLLNDTLYSVKAD